jgi:hypothetical protein
MSVTREDVACYRLYAVNCVELAQRIHDPDRRLYLLRMAQAWGKLAHHAEEHAEAANADASPDSQGDVASAP